MTTNSEGTAPAATSRSGQLTADQLLQYDEQGYVKNLVALTEIEVIELQKMLEELAARLPKDIDINQVNMWHKCSPWLYRFCRHPMILGYVESVLGANFYQWGGQFFVKYPGDGAQVPWHQDAQYWPLTPQKTTSVWLAVYDVDEDNAAMRIMAGSHRRGEFTHHENDAPHYVLEQEADISSCSDNDIVTMSMKAGEISLHDSRLLHSSSANESSRMRCGLTMRFSPTNVQCDLSVWPTFEAYLAHGEDLHQLNPVGPAPVREGFPVRKFQHSSEFR